MNNPKFVHTILGAGGAIGAELPRELSGQGQRVRFVGRNSKLVAGAAEVVAADVSKLDQMIKAVSGRSFRHATELNSCLRRSESVV